MPVWSTAGVQAESKGDEVNIINDKDVDKLEQRALQDLTDSGM